MASESTSPPETPSHPDSPDCERKASTVSGRPSYASDRSDKAAQRSGWRIDQRQGDTGFSASGAVPGQSTGGHDQYGWGGFPQAEARAASNTDADYRAWREKQIAAYDTDYLTWREAQMRRHDEDYQRWLEAQAAAKAANEENE